MDVRTWADGHRVGLGINEIVIWLSPGQAEALSDLLTGGRVLERYAAGLGLTHRAQRARLASQVGGVSVATNEE